MDDFLNNVLGDSFKEVKTWAIAMLAVSTLHLILSFTRK